MSDEIEYLRDKVKALEEELADTLEDAVRQVAHLGKGGVYHSNGDSLSAHMMGRLRELGRFEITFDNGGHIVSGRFFLRVEKKP